MDFGLDMDVSNGRVEITLAGSKRGFAFGTGQNGDEVRFLAVVAENCCRGAGIGAPLHVGFACAVVGDLAWWFASDSKGICVVARGFGSPESVKIEVALSCFWICRGRWWWWRGRFGGCS